MLEDARALQDAGCFSLVLEAVPEPVARTVSEKLDIPTIGIGAGPGCDGQVLVFHDILGLFSEFAPQFVKKYADLSQPILTALTSFCEEVRSGAFPTAEHSFKMDARELEAFLKEVG